MNYKKQLLTPDEVIEVLRIPKSTLYKLCNEGEIPAAKIGKHWRFDLDRVNLWLEQQFQATDNPHANEEKSPAVDRIEKEKPREK